MKLHSIFPLVLMDAVISLINFSNIAPFKNKSERGEEKTETKKRDLGIRYAIKRGDAITLL